MTTTTTNLHLTLPDDGGSDDVWGLITNANWGLVDAKFAPSPQPGVVMRDNNGIALATGYNIDWITGMGLYFSYKRNGTFRWFHGTTSDPESTGDAGSDFIIERAGDPSGGTPPVQSFHTAVRISRKTGVTDFEATPTVNGDPLFHAGNFNSAELAEPIGTIKMYAGDGDVTGADGVLRYLICDGRSLPTTDTRFTDLFAIIAYKFGGSGTSFNIPDLQDRVPMGKRWSGPSIYPPVGGVDTRTLGYKLGEGAHLLTINEIPAHVHPITDKSHHHTYPLGQFQAQSGGGGIGGSGAASNSSDSFTGITSTDNNTASAPGVGQTHNNVQPSLVLNFIIRIA